LELPHRHEEDNVHDFQRGLRPSIHKEVALKSPKTLHEAIQAALQAVATETKIETTQRPTCRLNVIEEDSDLSESVEKVDSESEENSHGATDEKPRELYEIRRLTQDEVDRFNKEGKCSICHKKGHLAIDCLLDIRNKKNDKTRKPRAGK
jgi:tRNA A37 N6-isopentenylltransferase MiaA